MFACMFWFKSETHDYPIGQNFAGQRCRKSGLQTKNLFAEILLQYIFSSGNHLIYGEFGFHFARKDSF